jgi:sugar lactone lactonase YvrE
VAALAEFAPANCNDMVVDADGNAYVGHFGFDPEHEQARSASLLRVAADGTVTVVAEPVEFPNGAVITPDGRTLILAESWTHDLTAFDIEPDGTLTNRRLWAHLEGAAPDGICLDEDGAIWLASPISKEVLRVIEGGNVLARISTGDQRAITCGLGGKDRRTLFISTVGRASEMANGNTGRILAIDTTAAGVGRP